MNFSFHSAATEVFVGKYDPAQFLFPDSPLAALPASPLHGLPARDWPAIRVWADTLPAGPLPKWRPIEAA